MKYNKNLFIVGAGFSHNAGLPLASEFTQELLNTGALKFGQPSTILVDYMKKCINDLFGNGNELNTNEWPALEDLFTIIDLSANTGHNLGPDYSASDLRTVRRVFLVRLIRMLRGHLVKKSNKPDFHWQKTTEFFQNLDVNSSSFLSLNWDNVIEELIVRNQGPHDIDYGFPTIAANFHKNEVQLRRGRSPAKSVTLLKPHGSVNWMYCDSCRCLCWFPPSQNHKIADRLFKDSDADRVFAAIGKRAAASSKPAYCPRCKAESLGTRFATFSYRKALDFPMHQSTWNRAEIILQESDNWIFFGYSMPDADFEFKYLLKRVHLSRLKKPNIYLVTKSKSGDDKLLDKFRKFFGQSSLPITNYLQGGMDSDALAKFRTIGALR